MIIRSQDRKTIINMNSSGQIYVDDSFSHDKATIYSDFPDGRTAKLGEYETSEHAIKILDEICEAFRTSLVQHQFVYQMP